MKHMKKTLVSLLALLLVAACLFGTVSCDPNKGDATDTTGTADGGNGNLTPGSGGYTVRVKTKGGMALSGVVVYIYTDATLDDVVNFGTTDENGTVTINAKQGSGYHAVLSGVPEGYDVKASYPFSGNTLDIVLTSSVITSTTQIDFSTVEYELGDVMHDFTVTTVDGVEIKLSDVLKTKETVMLNFWYIDCTWCQQEFPLMIDAYEKYKSNVEILALDIYATDTQDEIKDFATSAGLNFPVASAPNAMFSAFGVSGAPTSVVIDRYGVISMIHEGAILDERGFPAIFDHFIGDDYKQQLITDPSVLTPAEKPNVSMPSSEEIAAAFEKDDAALNATYSLTTENTSAEEAEYSWPFIIGTKDGETCIYGSNQNRVSSFSILYADIELKKGQALAFDYYSSCEFGNDMLAIVVDGQSTFEQISGHGDGWSTYYPYVAAEDGVYQVAFCYTKDSADNEGDDTVYLKDLRVVDPATIDRTTYIPRNAATNRKEDGSGYENYVAVVLNQNDGYYHVGDANGPLLIAGLMTATNFSALEESAWYLMNDAEFVIDGVDYYDTLMPYFTYSANGKLTGYCTVTEELAGILQKIAGEFGIEKEADGVTPLANQWLQMCMYYDAYGTNGVQFPDPIKGLSKFAAYEVVLGTNTIEYDGREIMPRGYLNAFTPAQSGVYCITATSDQWLDAWIFLDEYEDDPYKIYESGSERLGVDQNSVRIWAYMEAGTTYYLDIAFWNVTAAGTIEYTVTHHGDVYHNLTVASPGYFTFEDGEIANENETIAGGIKVVFDEEVDYYRELRADGSKGSILFADFLMTTAVFQSNSLYSMIYTKDAGGNVKLIEHGAFDFSMSSNDHMIEMYKQRLEKGGTQVTAAAILEAINADEYTLDDEGDPNFNATIYIQEYLEGTRHGDGEDLTAVAAKYADMMTMFDGLEDVPELEGCVPVNRELADLLQSLMDKYSFHAEDTFTKLCYYYEYVGALTGEDTPADPKGVLELIESAQ